MNHGEPGLEATECGAVSGDITERGKRDGDKRDKEKTERKEGEGEEEGSAVDDTTSLEQETHDCSKGGQEEEEERAMASGGEDGRGLEESAAEREERQARDRRGSDHRGQGLVSPPDGRGSEESPATEPVSVEKQDTEKKEKTILPGDSGADKAASQARVVSPVELELGGLIYAPPPGSA
ncbi:cyclic nucleotide-gated cation channel beta-1, partial [Aplysia californica]|uniref:Cyclic nucleotide-gated cation channel beta-1 n=1 Tax=Aplysia californica TaxID=6500 RepID=A0ABM1AFK4_APLCA